MNKIHTTEIELTAEEIRRIVLALTGYRVEIGEQKEMDLILKLFEGKKRIQDDIDGEYR
jgi:hypothetical protein